MQDLTLDELLKVLDTPDVTPKKPAERQIPVGIIKFMHEARCQDGYKNHRCHTATSIRIFGIPYCTTHALYHAQKVINSLVKQMESLNIQPNFTFCCNDPGDCNATCNGRG